MNTILRFTTTEAADHARCHRDTILKALDAGELHGSQRIKNGRWTIRRECLDAWLDGSECEHQIAGAA